MRILSPLQSSFAKAAGHSVLRLFNENAAKITGTIGIACDALLSSVDYIKNNVISLNIPPTPDQLLSLSGVAGLTSCLILLGADRKPGLKKPVGALTIGGAGLAAAAGYTSGTPELYGAAAAEAITGLAFVFEKQANNLAGKIKDNDTWLSYFAQSYLKHPVAPTAIVQALGATSAIAAGVNNQDQQVMITYGIMWMMASATMIMTDNGIKQKLTRIYKPDRNITPDTLTCDCP